ncbi:ABC transporter ATP-binding protein [Peribacillus simplex]|uniref:ABC transporter ATP-binding protein n=1 Tax=Peribacillus simplex TaxID=1478 RepID=UPI003CF3C150
MNGYLFRSSKLVWETSRIQLISMVIISVYQGFFPLLIVVLMQKLVNSVQMLIANQIDSINHLLMLVALQLLLLISNSLVRKWENTTKLVLQQNIEYEIKKRIASKTVVIEYSNFDNHEFYNLLQRVEGDVGSRFLTPFNTILNLGRNLISLVSLVCFLVQFHWSLLLLLGVTVIPNLVIQSRLGKQTYTLLKYQTPSAREHQYIFSLLKDRQSNKEIRLFQTGKYLINRWSNLFIRNNTEVLKLARKHQNSNLFLEIFENITYTSSILLLLWFVAKKLVKVGDFVAILDSLKRTQISVNEIVMLIARYYSDSLLVKDYFQLMDYSEEVFSGVDFPNTLQHSISVENLSFKYPFSNEKILNDISFDITPGETVVIVGENGSGKSTLVKCLSGLYKSQGNIKFDDIEINNINKKSLYNNIAITFQDFIKYEFTVSENIFLGEDVELGYMEKCASQVGANEFINELNYGYQTRLGKLFENSFDLSGGQWQRLSLARSLIKNAQLLILDEPTSSLDPVNEAELFKKFKEITRDRTSIFISHRMYSCQFADRIIVMNKGKIAEVGTHFELLNLKGEYYRLYTLQSDMFEKSSFNKSEVG